jgi:hypothetical protein
MRIVKTYSAADPSTAELEFEYDAELLQIVRSLRRRRWHPGRRRWIAARSELEPLYEPPIAPDGALDFQELLERDLALMQGEDAPGGQGDLMLDGDQQPGPLISNPSHRTGCMVKTSIILPNVSLPDLYKWLADQGLAVDVHASEDSGGTPASLEWGGTG